MTSLQILKVAINDLPTAILLLLIFCPPIIYLLNLCLLIVFKKIFKNLFLLLGISCLAILFCFFKGNIGMIFGVFFGIPYFLLLTDAISVVFNKNLKKTSLVLTLTYISVIISIIIWNNLLGLFFFDTAFSGFLVERLLFLTTGLLGLFSVISENKNKESIAIYFKMSFAVSIIFCWLYIASITFHVLHF